MTTSQISHDQNFKNLFLDFPGEALKWILPEALQTYGSIHRIDFLRQEPKKHRLSDSHKNLDLPILFTFEHHAIILWLIEFQEDKHKFSIYKLLHYVVDMVEAYPQAIVVPTMLFTDRRKWRKDVDKQLEVIFCDKTLLLFKYLAIRLFNYEARDFYDTNNPLVKILLPKMNYPPSERYEVIRQAYKGLFQLATPMLFDKYIDFIDVYAEIKQNEREQIYSELKEQKETAMLAQYIKEKGIREGIREGVWRGETQLLGIQMADKYNLPYEKLQPLLDRLSSEMLLELGKRILYWDSYEQVQDWIRQQTENAK